MGPLGYKTLCNACGIRWRRENKSQTSDQEKKSQNRKKKKNEVERLLLSDDQNVIKSGKRNRTQRIIDDPFTDELPLPNIQGNHSPDQIKYSPVSPMVDQCEEEEEFQDGDWPPASRKKRIRTKSFEPGCLGTKRLKIGKPKARRNSSGALDVNLLREILNRLENLRKEHNRTTKQVQSLMEECRANPEIYYPQNNAESTEDDVAMKDSSPIPIIEENDNPFSGQH